MGRTWPSSGYANPSPEAFGTWATADGGNDRAVERHVVPVRRPRSGPPYFWRGVIVAADVDEAAREPQVDRGLPALAQHGRSGIRCADLQPVLGDAHLDTVELPLGSSQLRAIAEVASREVIGLDVIVVLADDRSAAQELEVDGHALPRQRSGAVVVVVRRRAVGIGEQLHRRPAPQPVRTVERGVEPDRATVGEVEGLVDPGDDVAVVLHADVDHGATVLDPHVAGRGGSTARAQVAVAGPFRPPP